MLFVCNFKTWSYDVNVFVSNHAGFERAMSQEIPSRTNEYTVILLPADTLPDLKKTTLNLQRSIFMPAASVG